MGSRGWKQLLILVIVAVLAIGAILPVYANSIDDYLDDRDNIKEELDGKKDDLKQTKSELDSLREQLEALDDDMYAAEVRLSILKAEIVVQEDKIVEQENLIAEIEESIAETEEYLKVQTEHLEQRLRAMYKNGTVSYLEVIFSASSFTDFLSRLGFLSALIESDKELVAGIEATKTILEADKSLLDHELDLQVQRMEELDSAKIQVEEDHAKLAQQAAQYEVLNTKVLAELKKLNSDIAWLEAEEKRLSAEINKIYEQERVNAGDPPSFFTWPVPGFDRRPPTYTLSASNITSPFGMRKHPITGKDNLHRGIDIARRNSAGESIGGKPIVAAAGGVVETAAFSNSYGYYVTISHGGGVLTLYAHMRYAASVKVGQTVTMGQQIGVVGTTGSSTGNHLHFEVVVHKVLKDPLTFEYR